MAPNVTFTGESMEAGLAVLVDGALTLRGSANHGLEVLGSQATFRNDGLLNNSHTSGLGLNLFMVSTSQIILDLHQHIGIVLVVCGYPMKSFTIVSTLTSITIY